MRLPVTPLFNRLVIKKEVKEITKSGIILPDSAKNSLRSSQGEIVSVGPDVNSYEWGEMQPDDQNYLKVGDKVLFGKYTGVNIPMVGQEYILLNNNDILCKIDHFIEDID